MASLKFIMDVNEDHQTDHTNKRDDAPANAGHIVEEPTNVYPHPHSGHVSSSGLAIEQHKDINQAVPSSSPGSQSKRRGNSARGPKSSSSTTAIATTTAATAAAAAGPPSLSSTAATSSVSSSSSSLPASTTRPPARRRSTASIDSMDQTGYGSAASSSSMGGLHHPNQPMRPMPPHSQGEIPMRLTPITGRVSRAKKGVPVHVCELCKPAKTFTRAEHLRRHQLSHQTPGFSCTYPGCERAFHRPDLLARHQQRHEVEGDKVSSKSGGNEDDRRTPPSIDDGYPRRTPSLPQGIRGSPPAVSGSGPGGVASPSSTDVSSQHGAPGGPRRYSQQGSSNLPATPRAIGAGGAPHYPYSMPPTTLSIIDPTHPGVYSGAHMGYRTPPRTAPQSMSLPTLDIPDHNNRTPDLYHPQHDLSPWTSSPSDSTYSTPASDIPRQIQWQSTNGQLLPPYPNPTPRNHPSSSSFLLSHPFPSQSYPPAPPPQSYSNSVFDVSINAFGQSPTVGQQHSVLGGASGAGFRTPHHQHNNSITSTSSPIQPPNTSSHTGEALIATAAHPTRLDPLTGLGRRKELMEAHHNMVDAQAAMSGLDVLADMGVGYGGGIDGSGNGGDHEGGILTALDNMPLAGGCGITAATTAIPLQRPVRASIPGYLDVYWDRVDPLFPVVHRRSFEAAPEDVLRCAMAAVATQRLNSKEDRIRGNQLHEFAWHEAKRVTSWTLQTMQAILLLEYFARFRGRKAVTKPSKLFESLYSRVLYQNPAMFDSTILDADQHLPAEERWPSWLDTEARRRLLAGCFLLDGHASLYHQSWRAHDFDSSGMTPSPPVPLFGRSATVWAASSAEEWATILAADPGAGIPAFALPSEQLTPEYIMKQKPFDRMGILGVEMLRLPRPQPATSGSAGSSPAPEVSHSGSQLGADQQLRHLHSGGHQPGGTQESLSADVEEHISKLFAKCPTGNTYLALHHTPLHDLLAVSGDSWVFSQKVLPVTSFLEHQKRLKLWSEQHSRLSSASSVGGIGSLSAAKATVYAARAILGFLEREQGSPYSGSSWSADLSDYWALYVCALICWAFGHRARPAPAADARQNHHYHHQHQRSSSAGSGTYSPASRLSTSAAAAADEGALGWLRMVAADNMRLEDVVRVRARREAAGVVGLVLRRLESDCVGGRSRLYVDAVGVLRKLEEGANWKWF